MFKKIMFAIIGCIVGVLVTYLCMTTSILSTIADKFVALDMSWHTIAILGVGVLIGGVFVMTIMIIMMIRSSSQALGVVGEIASKSAATWLQGNFGKRKS